MIRYDETNEHTKSNKLRYCNTFHVRQYLNQLDVQIFRYLFRLVVNDIYNNLCWQPCFLLTYFMKFHIIHRKK